jgi:hypothetical protein
MNLIRMFVVVILVLVTFSCSTIVKREISPENTFISTLPNLTINMDEPLVYRGTFTVKDIGTNEFHVNLPIEKEYHIWKDADGNCGVMIIYMKLLRLGSFWHENIFNKNEKYTFWLSKEGAWHTRVGLRGPTEKEDTMLNEMGLDFSKLIMTKMWAKKCMSNVMALVIYSEKIEDRNLLTQLNIGKEALNEDQSRIIRQFAARASQQVRIVN